jgi:Zn-dependent peptidase ImmA (M78 family)
MKSQEDIEADQFARALLMPADMVKAAWYDLKSPLALSEIFKVSYEQMAIRLAELDLI